MKLLDIGNTVERAVANATELGVDFLTVHGHDLKTLRAAVAGRGKSRLKLLGRHRAHQPDRGGSEAAGHLAGALRPRA